MSTPVVVEPFPHRRVYSDSPRSSAGSSRTLAPVSRTPIVVGVDGSRESLNAANFALCEARLRQRPVLVLHAYGRRTRRVPDVSTPFVEGVLDQLSIPNGVRVETREVDGDAAAALLHAAPTADLVVVGRHRSGTGVHLLTGSVSSVLASHARCPVVVVADEWHVDRYEAGPVVVAVDAGAEDDDTLGFAFRRAHLARVPLVVLHSSRRARDGVQARSADDPMTVVERWSGMYPEVQVTAQYAGDGAKVAIAAAWTASLLVVGQPRAMAGPGSWLRSVGYAVVRYTVRPVAVVPRRTMYHRTVA